MKSASAPPIPRLAILKADQLAAHTIDRVARQVFRPATIDVFDRVEAAASAFARQPFDLLISGVRVTDGDTLDFMARCCQPPASRTRVLVVTGRKEPRLLTCFRDLSVTGVFDPTTEVHQRLRFALRRVAAGETYWSPAVLARLGAESPLSVATVQQLTRTEQIVLASIVDGTGNAATAARLGLKPSSVQSVRRSLHKKFGVRNSSELVGLAARLGFVHFTADGAERPGFSLLHAVWWKQHLRRKANGQRNDPSA